MYYIQLIRPNKNVSVFRVTGLKMLGRVGSHIFFYFFSEKKNNFMHFERRVTFQNASNFIFFSENLKKT